MNFENKIIRSSEIDFELLRNEIDRIHREIIRMKAAIEIVIKKCKKLKNQNNRSDSDAQILIIQNGICEEI